MSRRKERPHNGRRGTLNDPFQALLREAARAFQPGDLETAPTEELIALAGATLAQQVVLVLWVCDDPERPKQTVIAEAMAIMRLQPLAKLAAIDERAPQAPSVVHVLAERLAALEWFSPALAKRIAGEADPAALALLGLGGPGSTNGCPLSRIPANGRSCTGTLFHAAPFCTGSQ